MNIDEQLKVNRSIRVLDESDDSTPHKALEFSKLPTGYFVGCYTRTGKLWAGRTCTPEELAALAVFIRETDQATFRWHVGANTFYPWTFEFDITGSVTFRAWSQHASDTNWNMRRVRFRLDTKDRAQWNVLADNIDEALR